MTTILPASTGSVSLPDSRGNNKYKSKGFDVFSVSLDRPDAGLAVATRFAKEGAGMLTSLTETDGLVELPEELTKLQSGTEVDFVPYSELM